MAFLFHLSVIIEAFSRPVSSPVAPDGADFPALDGEPAVILWDKQPEQVAAVAGAAALPVVRTRSLN
jgi:hypothetical protein